MHIGQAGWQWSIKLNGSKVCLAFFSGQNFENRVDLTRSISLKSRLDLLGLIDPGLQFRDLQKVYMGMTSIRQFKARKDCSSEFTPKFTPSLDSGDKFWSQD